MIKQDWGAVITQSTFNTIEAMKAAKIAPDQGAEILVEVFADLVIQIDAGFPPERAFRKRLIARLAAEAERQRHAFLGRL